MRPSSWVSNLDASLKRIEEQSVLLNSCFMCGNTGQYRVYEKPSHRWAWQPCPKCKEARTAIPRLLAAIRFLIQFAENDSTSWSNWRAKEALQEVKAMLRVEDQGPTDGGYELEADEPQPHQREYWLKGVPRA